jgi:alpha-galactosidase
LNYGVQKDTLILAKIVIIGAGSHVFSRHLITDILFYPELRDSTITLVDIAAEPLALITAFANKLVKQHRFPTRIESTLNRRKALEGADCVFVTIRVGGPQILLPNSPTEFYGVELSRGDTVGAGGVFLGLRHIPVILDICRDMEELCPDAWLINYSNPMAINSWAINDYSRIKSVGLCHSVQHTTAELLGYLGVPLKTVNVPECADDYYHQFQNQVHEEFMEMSCLVAGINHMAWFLEFKWHGKDAYPMLHERFSDPAVYSGTNAFGGGPDLVRVEIFRTFGYFVTESSWHMASYVPYFKKRPELIKRYSLEDLRTGWKMRAKEDENLKQQINSNHEFPIVRSSEYGANIVFSIETGVPSRINANVNNHGLITNLPSGCCVEVPCLVDGEGIHPCHVGDLPPQLAALNRTNINVQELAVRGIVEKDKAKIFQSILIDPLTASILTIDETRFLVDEMFKTENKYLKGFK